MKTKEHIQAVRNYLFLSGLNLDDDIMWLRKWKRLHEHAFNNSGASVSLSPTEYIFLAVQAGLKSPDQIGKSNDSYQLGRVGDKGNYEIGNCRFITTRQNQLERKLNGGNDKISQKKLGRTKENDEGRLTTSTKLTGRTKETHIHKLEASIKQSKRFRLVSPTGKIFEGINLQEFCDANGLLQGNMANVCRGGRKQHKGWTGTYL